MISVESSFSDITFTSCETNSDSLRIKVNIIIYAIAVLLFVSWFLFALFGGIGLAAVPIDLFCSFKNRPKHMRSSEVERKNSGKRSKNIRISR